ncbi:MAG: TetR/AcrR family transcriptional regulator [Chloroflexota bacterium]
MARTIDIEQRAVRREAFVDTAERLFRTQGYADTSIQDILDALGASRGAFYHYFGSKTELLEAVTDRVVTTAIAAAMPVVEDPVLSAPEKLEGLFRSIQRWKELRADLMLGLLGAWLSDDNALMREKYRRGVQAALIPPLTSIAEQGITEGSFEATSAEGVARGIVHVVLGLQEQVIQLYVDRHDGLVTFDDVWRILSPYPGIFERIAGLRPGSFQIADETTLRQWFG